MALTTPQLRDAWAPACKRAMKTISFGAGGARITVAVECVQAFVALAAILAKHGYHVRKDDTGAYNCRKITGGYGWSLHAFGICVDINWQSNPYSRTMITDMPPAMVSEILSLRTGNGKRVFRWGGDWDYIPSTGHRYYDAMHFEIVCTPADLATGIVMQEFTPPAKESDMGMVLTEGMSGPEVGDAQELINLFLVATGTDIASPNLLATDNTWGSVTTRTMGDVIVRLRTHAFHQLGTRYPIMLKNADPRRLTMPMMALMAAAIAEREL